MPGIPGGPEVSLPGRGATRDIARAAVRAELARVALDVFRRDGFEQVTVNDVAAAAGVSRSTFLRYFASKEDPVLRAIDDQGDRVLAALQARPAAEDDWTALRRAMDPLIDEDYRDDLAGALARSQLIYQTPALCAGCRERQAAWRPSLAGALAGRAASPGTARSAITTTVRAAAAIDCLSVAAELWTASRGSLDLGDLLDEAFAALTRRAPHR